MFLRKNDSFSTNKTYIINLMDELNLTGNPHVKGKLYCTQCINGKRIYEKEVIGIKLNASVYKFKDCPYCKNKYEKKNII